MWWRRQTVLHNETLNDLILILMHIEAKLDNVLNLLQEDDDGEAETDE